MLLLRSLIGLLLLTVLGMGQNPEDGKGGDQIDIEDPLLEALTAEAARKKKEAEIAESEQTIRKAQPGANVKALEGKTTIDDKVVIESEVLSNIAVQEISKQIANRVNDIVQITATDNDKATIYIHDTSLHTAIRADQYFQVQKQDILTQKNELDTEFGKLVPCTLNSIINYNQEKSLVGGRSFLGAAIAARSAIDLLSLFRQDTEFKGRSFTVREEALVAQVAHEIKKQKINAVVVYPSLMPPGLSNISDSNNNSDLIRSIKKLQNVRSSGAQRIRKLQIEIENNSRKRTELEEHIKSLEEDDEERQATQSVRNQELSVATDKLKGVTICEQTLEKLKPAYADLNDLVGTLLGILLNTKEGAGNSLLGTLLTAESILNRLRRDNVYFLSLKPVAAGGSYRIRRNLFTTLFTGPLLSYSGGAIITFMLLDKDSTIVTSGTLQHMNGFSKFKSLKTQIKSHNSD